MIRILLLLAASSIASTSFAQGTCATAVPVVPGLYNVPLVNGPQAPEPICAGNGVADNGMWYSYTAPADQSLTVSTDLPQNIGDTRLHIYAGSCDALVCIGGDDDSGTGFLSIATVSVQQGNTYYIAFDDYWLSLGFDFMVSVGTPPPPPPPSNLSFTQQDLAPANVLGIVDMNNDHLDDMVIVSNNSVNISEQQQGGGFVTNVVPTPTVVHFPSWSLCAGDIDGNGWNDLMYGGTGGVSFMFRGDGGGAFTQQATQQYIFSQRTNMVDIDNDGNLDAFVCHDVDANVRFMNQGDGTLTLIQGGLGSTCGNYGSLWTDMNNDGLMDLHVSKCGCDPVDILMLNQGAEQFVSTAEENGFADTQQSWSSAWGDFDNDGYMDVLVGKSSGFSHKLMRNNGDGTFTNVTAGSGFDTFAGSSIEWTTHDFDNDGNLDIMGGWRIMMGNGDMTFTERPGQVANGPVGDLNNDGFLDYMNGSTAFINDGNDNHWLKVATVGTVSNKNGIGARIEVTTASGTRIREIRSGDGFRFMSSLTAHFGLGQDTHVDQVVIRWPSGIVQTLTDLPVDTMLVVEEGVNTQVAMPAPRPVFNVYPNPASTLLYWNATNDLVGRPYIVFDIQGRLSLSGLLGHGPIDVSSLAPGTYFFSAEGAGSQQKFMKE
jgi:hypothetical protein